MIRGVDRKVRKAVKAAAKAEGVSLGVWVRRALERSLQTPVNGALPLSQLSRRIRLCEARMEMLEKLHRGLQNKILATAIRAPRTRNEKRQVMAAGEEIELKLRIDPDNAARIRQSGWWRALGRGTRKQLHAVYFDTPDRRLYDLDMVLRTRSDGDEIVQTIKMVNGSDTMHRREWETLIPDAIPDPTLVIDPDIPPAFRRLTSADLAPVFDVDIRRDTRELKSNDTRIELSLDEGTVASGARQEPISEIELELNSGNPEQLFAEARRLGDLSGGWLHARTKSELGYLLAEGPAERWSKAPRVAITEELNAGEAFRTILRSCFAHLTENDDCARLDLHVEGVHQSRVALRRIRSVLKIFQSVLRGKRRKQIEGEVRWLGKVLGSARDLDVFQDELLQPAVDALGEPEHLAPLIVELESRRKAAYAAVNEALSSSRYRHFLIDLFAYGHAANRDLFKSEFAKGGAERPVAEFAATALSAVHRALLKRGQGFEKLTRDQRHEVRIVVKKMRYAVDFFGTVFDNQQRARFSKKSGAVAGRSRPHERRGGRRGHAHAPDRGRPRRQSRHGRHDRRRRARVPIDRQRQARLCGRRRSRLAPPPRGGDRQAPGQGLEFVRARQAVLAAPRSSLSAPRARQAPKRQ